MEKYNISNCFLWWNLVTYTVGASRLTVCKNRVLRRIFGPERDELTGEWRRLHNLELNDIYSSPNITRLIKLSKKSWAGHVACMGIGEVHTAFWLENLKERDHLKEPVPDERKILKRIFKKRDGGMDWIHLVRYRERLWALVSVVMSLRVQ